MSDMMQAFADYFRGAGYEVQAVSDNQISLGMVKVTIEEGKAILTADQLQIRHEFDLADEQCTQQMDLVMKFMLPPGYGRKHV